MLVGCGFDAQCDYVTRTGGRGFFFPDFADLDAALLGDGSGVYHVGALHHQLIQNTLNRRVAYQLGFPVEEPPAVMDRNLLHRAGHHVSEECP